MRGKIGIDQHLACQMEVPDQYQTKTVKSDTRRTERQTFLSLKLWCH